VLERGVQLVPGDRLVGNPETFLAVVCTAADRVALNVELGDLDHVLAIDHYVLDPAPYRVRVEERRAWRGHRLAFVIDVRPGTAVATRRNEGNTSNVRKCLLGAELHFAGPLRP